MRDNLNHNNFWKALEEKYPRAFAHLKQWTEKYMSDLGWKRMYFEEDGTNPETENIIEHMNLFEYMPLALQVGMLAKFFHEDEGTCLDMSFCFSGDGDMIAYLEEHFKELNESLETADDIKVNNIFKHHDVEYVDGKNAESDYPE